MKTGNKVMDSINDLNSLLISTDYLWVTRTRPSDIESEASRVIIPFERAKAVLEKTSNFRLTSGMIDENTYKYIWPIYKQHFGRIIPLMKPSVFAFILYFFITDKSKIKGWEDVFRFYAKASLFSYETEFTKCACTTSLKNRRFIINKEGLIMLVGNVCITKTGFPKVNRAGEREKDIMLNTLTNKLKRINRRLLQLRLMRSKRFMRGVLSCKRLIARLSRRLVQLRLLKFMREVCHKQRRSIRLINLKKKFPYDKHGEQSYYWYLKHKSSYVTFLATISKAKRKSEIKETLSKIFYSPKYRKTRRKLSI